MNKFECAQCGYIATEDRFENGCWRCGCLAYSPYTGDEDE